MVNQDQIIIQLSIWFDGNGFDTTIQGLNGSFDIDHMRGFLQASRPYYGGVLREIKKQFGQEDYIQHFYTVYAEIIWQEKEVQEGTGYGDILVLPGYYHIGKVIKIIKNEPPIEGPENIF